VQVPVEVERQVDASGAEVVEPSADLDKFNCAHGGCGAFAHQLEGEVWFRYPTRDGGYQTDGQWRIRRCERCEKISVWVRTSFNGDTFALVYPRRVVGTRPHPDMPPGPLGIYEEARSIASLSPRSAAGLLRLALQTLVDDLEPGNNTLNGKIGKLVGRGLDPMVQQTMDVLRAFGNNGVHPGEIRLDDDPSLVPTLFRLLNLVVEQMITRPSQVQSLYDSLPQTIRDGIDQRNQKAVGAS
jgi:hypothetical protein